MHFNELLTKMKVRITFSLLDFVHATNSLYVRTSLSHVGIHYYGGARRNKFP